ncbi:MAG: coagulation factor 5/8 type domain-containing protein, partial [Phycisphaerales bacterium JB059]
VGGHTPIRSVQATTGGMRINSRDVVRSLTPADGVSVASVVATSVGDRVRRDGTTARPALADDEHGFVSGGLVYSVSLAPGAERDIIVAGRIGGGEVGLEVASDPERVFAERLEQERARWTGLLWTPRIELPGAGGAWSDAARTTTAHILINQDGPAIQPGSRTYERSWIRDGSITSLALIAGGHVDRARAFVDWYAPYQYPSGKVPCVVDRRGPDPVDEHDSTGELIFALWQTYLATGDLAFLARHEERVRRGVDYLRSLREERLTEAYLNSEDPLERAKAGLVPESISHEGYSAKPMHSYWDDFFVLRGLLDAASIAGALGAEEDQRTYAALADEFERSLFESIRLAMQAHGIEYIPGCVELGDFDATSTSIAVFPGGLLGSELAPALRATFDRYWTHFTARRDGSIQWRDFTPYEFRLVATFVRLGEPQRALAMLDWLMEQRTPAGWNQWPEVGYRDPMTAGFVGDIPHTWVGSAFILSFYSLFAYEEEAEGGVVIAPGIDPDWVAHPDGIRVDGLFTRWGPLDFTIQRRNGACVVDITRAPHAPGGLRICPPPGDWMRVTMHGRLLQPDDKGRYRVDAAPGVVRFEKGATP